MPATDSEGPCVMDPTTCVLNEELEIFVGPISEAELKRRNIITQKLEQNRRCTLTYELPSDSDWESDMEEIPREETDLFIVEEMQAATLIQRYFRGFQGRVERRNRKEEIANRIGELRKLLVQCEEHYRVPLESPSPFLPDSSERMKGMASRTEAKIKQMAALDTLLGRDDVDTSYIADKVKKLVSTTTELDVQRQDWLLEHKEGVEEGGEELAELPRDFSLIPAQLMVSSITAQ